MGNTPDQLQQIPSLALSAGDLALVLSGHKRVHYAPLNASTTPGFVRLHGFTVAGEPVSFTARITSVRRIDPPTVLDKEQLRAAGRVVLPTNTGKTSTPKRLFGGRTGLKLEQYLRSYRLPLAGELFSEDARFTPPSQYTAQEMAGDTSGVQEIRLEPVAYTKQLGAKNLATIAEEMRSAAATLEPELRAAHATVRRSRAVKHSIGYTIDASMQQAVWFMRSQKSGRIEKAVRAIHAPGDRLLKLLAPPVIIPMRAEQTHADGIGQNQLLGGSSESISLGRALLLFTGANKHIITRKPLVYVRGQGNYTEPVTMRLQALGTKSKTGHRNHAVEVPMVVDVAQTDTLMSGGIDDATAKRYGYSSRKALLREVGAKPNDNIPLYISTVNGKATDLPIDTDRLGSYWNKIMDGLHNAAIGGKNGAASKRKGLRDPNKNLERSVRDALAVISTLPEKEQRAILTMITPYWNMQPEERQQWLSHRGQDILAADPQADVNGHQLPNDVRATALHAPHAAKTKPRNGNGKPKTHADADAGESPKVPQHFLQRGTDWEVLRKGKAPAPATATLAAFMPPELVPPAAQVEAEPVIEKTPEQIAEERRLMRASRAKDRREIHEKRTAKVRARDATTRDPEPESSIPVFTDTTQASRLLPGRKVDYPTADDYLAANPTVTWETTPEEDARLSALPLHKPFSMQLAERRAKQAQPPENGKDSSGRKL